MAAIDVFISSSFHDEFTLGFAKERAALKVELGKDPELNDISLDYGDPQDRGSVEESLARVEQSDLIVLFVGTRYGGIVEEEGISLTHLEYRKAMELKKSMLIYIFPQDTEHKEYTGTDVFIEEIEKDNKKIYAEVEKFLSKYKYDVLACKAGARDEDDQLKEKQALYFDALALKITNDISKLKNKLQSRLPFGVQEIKENKEEKLRYKQYLSNEKLPYVSRSEYKNEFDLDERFKSETDFYEEVFHGEYDGILISGEGGVGKTRLMFELGRKAQKNGWVTYQIFSDFKGWDTLDLDKNKQYCFLFDYVEENEYFSNDVFEILSREYEDVKIKVVANARNAYLLHNDLDSPLLNKVDLSENNANETGYIQYVVKKIFEYKNIDLHASGISLHELATKPSFAVFLLQGMLDNKNIDFHDINGFASYITKRLALTLQPDDPVFSNIDDDVFKLFFSLPIKDEMIPSSLQTHMISDLEQDGWIEYDDESEFFKSAYNDTIMDEILISYFNKQNFKIDRNLKNELERILNFAIEHSRFEHAFRSFDRIFEKSILLKKQHILENILENYLYQIDKISNIFIKSLLFPNIDKLKILSKIEDFDYSSNEFTHLLLKIMRDVDSEPSHIDLIEEVFSRWVKDERNLNKYSHTYEGSFLIPSYWAFQDKIKLDYIDIPKITLDWIEKFYLIKEADYVMGAYLKHEKEIANINEKIYAWIIKYGVQNSSFLLETYLSHDMVHLSEKFKYYLEQYINTKKNWVDSEYTFIVKTYIKKVETIENIDDIVTAWLGKNIESEQFTFVIYEYLKKVRSTERIDDIVTAWLGKNIESEQFTFVIDEYLKKVRSTERIDDIIVQWINQNKENKQFNYIVPKYLKKVCTTERIDDAISEWINAHYKYEGFTYMLVWRYIPYGGQLHKVLPGLNRYLDVSKQEALQELEELITDRTEQKKAHYERLAPLEKYLNDYKDENGLL